jgi:phosphoglycolate phosphatase
VRLVLWDIDGTLVDTAGHGRHAFADALREVLGRDADLGDITMSGRTDHAIAVELLERSGENDPEGRMPEMFRALNSALDSRSPAITTEGRVMPGVVEVIEALAARGDATQSLLTGNIEPNAHVKLRALGLDHLLDTEIGAYGSDSGVRPELVGVARRKAAELRGLDVPAKDTVLIGDTPLDVDAAHANDARAVAVATGRFSVPELERSGADAVLEDLSGVGAAVAAILG